VFGRRKREAEAAEAAREAERRVLLADLAGRPDTVCPFLGLADARAEYRPEPTGEHRCYAFGDPSPLSDEQQSHVCLERGYSNCPRYLRGVLVIPSEELEALRRPQAPAPPPEPAPVERRRRRGLVLVPLLLLLVAAVGIGGWYALGNGTPLAFLFTATATPTPSVTPASTATPTAPATAVATSTPVTATPTPSVTPAPTPVAVPSSGVFPTPGPDAVPTGGYIVVVTRGLYTVFLLDDSGNVTQQTTANFAPTGSPYSAAPVERIEGTDGRIYWRTLAGGYTGRAYTSGISGDFRIFRVFQSPNGDYTYSQLPASQL